MKTAPTSNVAAAALWINPGRILVALCLITIAIVAHEGSFALQDDAVEFYAEDIFDDLLNDPDYTFDEATETIAEIFGAAVAVNIAVLYCSPDPDPSCRDSDVWRTWGNFLDRLYGDYSVNDVDDIVDEMVMAGESGPFVTGIAVYWCSPEPGDGCGESRFTQNWLLFESLMYDNPNPVEAIERLSIQGDPVIAELIAASVCGHPTCYADEIAEFYSEDDAPDWTEPESAIQKTQKPADASGDLAFHRKTAEGPSAIKIFLCKATRRKNCES